MSRKNRYVDKGQYVDNPMTEILVENTDEQEEVVEQTDEVVVGDGTPDIMEAVAPIVDLPVEEGVVEIQQDGVLEGDEIKPVEDDIDNEVTDEEVLMVDVDEIMNNVENNNNQEVDDKQDDQDDDTEDDVTESDNPSEVLDGGYYIIIPGKYDERKANVIKERLEKLDLNVSIQDNIVMVGPYDTEFEANNFIKVILCKGLRGTVIRK